MIDSMQTKVSSQDSRKLDSLKVALAMRVLEPYKLDIQGAAQAFGYLYGTAQQSPEWPFHAFAYDSKAATWRRWEDGIGWQAEQTPLRFMTGVVDAMCALEAWRKHGVSTIAEQLAELEEAGDDVDDSDLAKNLGPEPKGSG